MIFVSKPAKGGEPQTAPQDEPVADYQAHAAPRDYSPPPPAPPVSFADAFGTAPAPEPQAAPEPAPIPAVTTAIVAALLEEVATVATDEQALGFLAALGRRVAVAHPLGQPTDLAEMESAANVVLAELGWGRTRLLAGQGGIRIIHQDWPAQLTGDTNGRWGDAFPLILAAIYERWFGTMGAPDDLRTTVVTRSRKAIELRHGRTEPTRA